MARLDAIRLASSLKDRLLRFSVSSNFFRDPRFQSACENIWKSPPTEGGLASDLWVEGSIPPLTSGKSLLDLVAGGQLSEKLAKQLIDRAVFPPDRPLYWHQYEAIVRCRPDRKPRPAAIVSAGTGAGKTESFLLPVLNQLVQERRQRHTGCRAFILYPMNALVNDQVDRLYDWLKGQTNLTICHFTSETPEEIKKAIDFPTYEGCRHQSRREARGLENHRGHKVDPADRLNPPDIMITNYSMLEYMLCRPQDRVFFGSGLRAVVLDEAHLYTGTLAAEMTLLLRRLYDKCGVAAEDVLQFATSATIGTGTQQELRSFASTIFSRAEEHVEVIQGRKAAPDFPEESPPANKTDLSQIAESTTAPTIVMDLKGQPELARCRESLDFLRTPLEQLVASHTVDRYLQAAEGHPAKALMALTHAPALQRLERILREAPQVALDDLAERLWGENSRQARRATASLLSLAASARHDVNDSPLLPHRLHLMLRPADGISACCNTQCPGPTEAVVQPLGALSAGRHEQCPYCLQLALEIFRCTCCGEPALGSQKGSLRPPLPFEKPGRLFSLTNCGEPTTRIDPDRRCLGGSGLEVTPLKQCPNCEGSLGDFHRIASSNALTLSILTETLFAELPELECSHQESNTFLPARGRRLLAFSDSRAEAARLGPRLRRQHEIQLVRSTLFKLFRDSVGTSPGVLAHYTKKIREKEESLALMREQADVPELIPLEEAELHKLRTTLSELEQGGRLAEWAKRLAADINTMSELLDEQGGERHTAATWAKDHCWEHNRRINSDKALYFLRREVARLPRRPTISVETVGAVEVVYHGVEALKPPSAYLGNLESSIARPLSAVWPDLVSALLDTVRSEQRVTLGTYEEDLAWEEGGAPMGRWLTLSEFRGVLPGHRRRRFARNVLRQAGMQSIDDASIDELLEAVFAQLSSGAVEVTAGQRTESPTDQFTWLETSLQSFEQRAPERSIRVFLPSLTLRKPNRLFYCSRTGHVWPRDVLGCSPDSGCVGSLQPITAEALDDTPLVGRQRQEYASDAKVFRIGLWAEEHSAQLSPREARRLQELFRRGMRNLLSATTTLELGIDIGGLSGTFLSNVPPGKANYLQRAGRVGRRADGSSVVVTCARSRPYDREVFRRIGDFLARPLRKPMVFLDRERIVRRHFHAWLMGKFFEQLYEPKDDKGAMTAFGHMGSFCHRKFPAKWERGMTKLPGLHDPAAPLPEQFVPPSWWPDSNDGLITPFRAWIAYARETADPKHLAAMFRGTALEGRHDWTPLFDAALELFDKVVKDWTSDYDALLQTWKTATKQVQSNSKRYQMLALAETTVIEVFADARFLPRYGFPIGVHKLRVITIDEDSNRLREEDQYRLERSGLLALREYVPGSQIMVGGKLLTSRGLLKHWTGANLDSAFGIRGGLAICPNQHQYYWQGTRQNLCPFCQEPSSNSFTDLLFPQHGFTTAAWDPPKRSSATETVGQVTTATTAFSAKAATDQSRASISEEKFAEIPNLRLQYEEEGEILVYNAGEHKKGFAICTLCGYASSEPEKGDKLPSGFATHLPLHAPAGPKSTPCLNRSAGATPLRHQLLGARQPTDLVMLDFGPYLTKFADRTTVVTSMAVALHLAGARLLQLDSRELGHMTVPAGEYGSSEGAAVFDNVPGGAGHVLELMKHGRAWLEAARDLLRGSDHHHRTCTNACMDCLMTFDAQNHFARGDRGLDRHLALSLVESLLHQGETSPDSPAPKDSDHQNGAPMLSMAQLSEGNTEEQFILAIEGHGIDQVLTPGTLCLFRRLGEDDPLPARDALVVVSHPSIVDPDTGQVTLRRFHCTKTTNEDGQDEKIRVTLRPRSTQRERYKNIMLDIPAAEWPTWRPLAVFEKIVEEA